MLEAEVLKLVLTKLKNYEFFGDILWYSRLNSGKINAGNSWIQLCKVGTPDVVSVIDCGNGKIAVLFIECKRTGIKRLRFEQEQFFNDMEGKPMVLCVLINDPVQLWPAIEKAKKL